MDSGRGSLLSETDTVRYCVLSSYRPSIVMSLGSIGLLVHATSHGRVQLGLSLEFYGSMFNLSYLSAFGSIYEYLCLAIIEINSEFWGNINSFMQWLVHFDVIIKKLY